MSGIGKRSVIGTYISSSSRNASVCMHICNLPASLGQVRSLGRVCQWWSWEQYISLVVGQLPRTWHSLGEENRGTRKGVNEDEVEGLEFRRIGTT